MQGVASSADGEKKETPRMEWAAIHPQRSSKELLKCLDCKFAGICVLLATGSGLEAERSGRFTQILPSEFGL